MELDIKLYVHGVPDGQNTWGVENFDRTYIEGFYGGRKSNLVAQMFVEVRHSNSSTYCYYTYIRTGNVLENGGRSGGYFALTLRIDYYYADIQNIYNVLDAAYNKFIVGTIVNLNGDTIKYCVTNFDQVDNRLKSLEKELQKYLDQFSSKSDLVPLNGFKANELNATIINILDCDVKTVMSHVKKYSSISVSPFQQSKREKLISQKTKSVVNDTNAQAEKQISEAKQNAERSIQAIRKEYQEADQNISLLQKKLETADNEITRLKNVENDLKLKLENALSYKEEYEKDKKDLDKKNKILEEIASLLSGLSEASKGSGINQQFNVTGGHEETLDQTVKEKKNKPWMRNYRIVIPIIAVILLVILVIILLKIFSKNPEQGEKKYTEVVRTPEDQVCQPSISWKDLLKIDLNETSEPVKCGKQFKVYLKIDDSIGKWDVKGCDCEIKDDKITPTKPGQCTISYIVDGETRVTRTIKVE